MAVAVRDRVGELAARWRRFGFPLGVGLGVAMGYATLGLVGFEGRVDYGAIGTVTNLAARLCDEAKEGHILVSQRVAAATEGIARLEALGEYTIKGFQRPIPVWNVAGLAG